MTPSRKINYIEALWRRKWLILPFVVLGTAAGFGAFTQMTPLYRAGAVVTYVPQTLSSSILPNPADSRRSQPNRVREIRGYVNNVEFLASVADEIGMKNPSRDDLVDLGDRFEIIKLDLENYRFAFVDRDPVRATDISNVFADRFVTAFHEEKLGRTQTSITFIEDEIGRLEAQLTTVQGRLAAYREEHKGALPSDRATNQAEVSFLRSTIADLERDIARVSLDRDKRLEMLRTNRTDIGATAPIGSQPMGSQDPRVTQLATLRQQLADAQLRYTDSHPEVVRLKANIQALIRRIQSEPFVDAAPSPQVAQEPGPQDPGEAGQQSGFHAYIQREIESLDARLEELRSEKTEAQARVKELERLLNESLTHQAEIEKLDGQITVVRNRLTQKQNTLQGLQSELEVVDRAMYERYELRAAAGVPILPFRPDIFQLTMMGLIGGLAFGVGAALLRELSDKKIYSSDEIEALLDVEIMANVERFHARRGRRGAVNRKKSKRMAHG